MSECTPSSNSPEMQMAQMLWRTHRWMATLAHELRDPLSAVMMSLDELSTFCASGPAADLRNIACDGAAHVARVIDDALDLCRADNGILRFQMERVDLSRIITAAVRNVQPVLSRKHHQVTLSLPCGPIWLQAHPTRMQQILTNLLCNAAKYTNPFGQIGVTLNDPQAA